MKAQVFVFVFVSGARCKEDEIGFNAAEGTGCELVVEAGIVDPNKVTRSALQTAASVAANLLDRKKEHKGSF